MLKKFISYYRPHLKLLVFVLTTVVFYTLIELTLPIFTRKILNDYIPKGDLNAVLIISAIMIALISLFAGLHYIVGFYGHMLGTSIENDMRQGAFAKLQKMSFTYFDKNKTGVIMTRLTSDLHEVAELAHHGIEEVLAVGLMLVLGYVYLIQLNFWMTTVLFLFTFVQLGTLLFARRNMIKSFRRLRSEHAQINSRLEGAISGIRLTRAFANEAYEMKRFKADNDKYIEEYKGAYTALSFTNACNNFFVQSLNVAVLVFGTILVLRQEFTLGDLFAYFLYFNLLATPIRRLMTMLEQFQQGWAGFERYQQLMDEPIEIQNSPNAVYFENPRGEIIFKNVEFTYSKRSEDILHQFDLHIPAGKMIALVGPSGVGKTTIAQLIPRFYEITAGELLIDGIDVRDYDMQSLRRHIGYVQQDVIIFWGTIRENIAYGDPEAPFAKIQAAAVSAGIHDFITALPDGYETMVGERGVMLSGGQKQRLSLSRIFLKNPKILILDEATSALDNITEAYIQESIEKLTQNRTVLVVAHRLSTVQKADEIVVLGEEGVVQRGKHQELLAIDGHYKKLYEASQNGIIGE